MISLSVILMDLISLLKAVVFLTWYCVFSIRGLSMSAKSLAVLYAKIPSIVHDGAKGVAFLVDLRGTIQPGGHV